MGNRSVKAIERELDETTQRLANEVDELVARLRPGRILRSGADDAKRRVLAKSGTPRPEVIGAIAGAVVVGLVLWRLSKR